MVLLASLALLAASQTQAPNLSQSVTFKEVGAPTAKTIAELAKLTGVPLTVAPAAKTDTLVIDVKNIPLSTLMEKIAIATDGKWDFESGEYYLGVNTSVRQAKDSTAITQAAANFNKQLQKDIADSEKRTQDKPASGSASTPASSGQATAALVSRFFQGSAGLDKALLTIGGQAFASIRPGSRVVFSSNPTATQLALPHEAASYLLQDYKASLADNDSGATKGVPSTVLIILTRDANSIMNMNDSISVSSVVYDAKGDSLDTENSTLSTTDLMARVEAAMAQLKGKSPKPATPAEKPIELTPEAKALFSFGQRFMATGSMTLPPDILAKLLDVQSKDPISYVGELACGLAESKSEQLVADLPDSSMTSLNMDSASILPSQVAEQLKNGDTIALSEAAGWMLLSPTNGTVERTAYEPRTDLAHLISIAQANKTMDLKTLMQLEPFFYGGKGTILNVMMVSLVNPSSMMGMITANWPLIDFYRTLDPSSLAANEPIKLSFDSLTPAQKSALNYLIYGPPTNLTAAAEKKSTPEDEMEQAMMSGFGDMASLANRFMASKNYQTEPTEVAPDGLPSAGYVLITVSKTPVLLSADKAAGISGILGGSAMPVKAVAAMQAITAAQPAMSGLIPSPKSFRVGQRSSIAFKFFVSPTVYQAGTLNDDNFEANGPVYSLNDLPGELETEYQADLAKFKKLASKFSGNPTAIPTHP